jgi:hypothetical protein
MSFSVTGQIASLRRRVRRLADGGSSPRSGHCHVLSHCQAVTQNPWRARGSGTAASTGSSRHRGADDREPLGKL